MKSTKKVLVMCLFIFLATSIVFAMGGNDDAGKTVLNIMGYGDNASAEGQSFLRIVEAFEAANPDIKVNYELLFEEPYHQKVIARLASGDVPDVAYMGSDARWGKPWQEAGQQVDITDLIDPAVFNIGAFGGPDGANGEYYYVPIGTGNFCTVMYANVELLTSLGLELPKTYGDLKAMVPVARANNIEVLTTHGAGSWVWGSCVMSSIFAQTTGKADWPQQLVAGEVSMTDADAVAALEFLETMVADGVISEETVLLDTGTATSNFSQGKALFFMSGQWDAGNVAIDLQETMKMMPFPAVPGAKGQTNTVSAAKSTGYGITKSAMEKGLGEAAMRFIEFFNSEQEVEQRLRDGAIVAPVLANYVIPSDMPTIVGLKSDLATSSTLTQVIDSQLVGAPNDTLNTGFQEIVSGRKSPQEVAESVQALIK